MNWIKQLVSDGEQPSTLRVLLLIVVLVWAVLCIRQNTFVVPDIKVIGFIGTLLGAKVGQSYVENTAGSPVQPASNVTPIPLSKP